MAEPSVHKVPDITPDGGLLNHLIGQAVLSKAGGSHRHGEDTQAVAKASWT